MSFHLGEKSFEEQMAGFLLALRGAFVAELPCKHTKPAIAQVKRLRGPLISITNNREYWVAQNLNRRDRVKECPHETSLSPVRPPMQGEQPLWSSA